jgi:TonB family protein
MFHVGNGMSPPHITYHQEPEFSESARAAKYQGTVILMLGVNKEGSPTNLRISQPIGCGLDEKAVQAVRNWKFAPAERDGVPVDADIAVEVDFHLY